MNRSLRRLLASLLVGLSLVSGPALADRASAMAHIANSMLADIGEATSIDEGQGNRAVYIFFDPNCPYCHRLYDDLRPWVKKGGWRFHWIPVGILTPTSAGKAAALLDAKNPLAALEMNENHFDRSGGLGGIGEALEASAHTEAALKANEALLNRVPVGGVPMILFRADDNSPVLMVGGPPASRLGFILSHVRAGAPAAAATGTPAR